MATAGLSEVAQTRLVAARTVSVIGLLYADLLELVRVEPQLEPLSCKLRVIYEVIEGCVEGTGAMPVVQLPTARETWRGLSQDSPRLRGILLHLCNQLDSSDCKGTADSLRHEAPSGGRTRARHLRLQSVESALAGFSRPICI